MGKKGTTTYLIGNVEKGFYFQGLKDAFRHREKGVSVSAMERQMGDAVGVTSDAVHQWRFEKSAPGDIETVRRIEGFLGLAPGDLLCDIRGGNMERLTDRQRDAAARIYAEIEDYVLAFSQSDGFVWKNYVIKDGSPFAKYLISFDAMHDPERCACFKDGVDFADAAWTYLMHALDREWVNLAEHPLFPELEAYIDGPLLDMWNGKTDPDYRFEAYGPEDDMADRSNLTATQRAIKGARKLISQYL